MAFPAAPPGEVGIDARLYAGNFTGIGVYTRGIVDHLPTDGPLRYLLCSDRPLVSPAGMDTLVLPSRRRLLWTQVLLPSSRRARQLQLFHATANHECPLALPCPVVLTVHDLIPLLFPDTVSPRHRLVFRTLIGPAVRCAARVLVPSEAVRRSLLERWRLPEKKVLVTPEACEERFFAEVDPARLSAVLERYGIRPPYLLTVGALEPRKNIPLLVRTFADLVRRGELRDWQLVLGGSGGWNREAILAEIRQAGLGERLVVTGFVPDEDLPALYRGASLFVFPSRYEGFGLPAVEAMAAGVPTLVGAATALEELVGEAGATFSLDDEVDLGRRLQELAGDDRERERLAAAGRLRARTFSWELTAALTVDAYRQAIEASD